MKNISIHSGVLNIIKREKSSLNGNPRYCVFIDGVTCYTMPDSTLGYSITNYDGKMITCEIGTYYGKPTIKNVKVI